MRAYEAWSELSQNLHHEILESAYIHNKKLYRNLIEDMAQNLRFRPQRLLDTPRKERHAQFHILLGLPNFDILAQNLLMSWLLCAEWTMMGAFLDELKIPHDGKGCVEHLPEKVDENLLKKSVENLYQKFDPEKVSLYLKTFDTVGGQHWITPEMIHAKAETIASPI
ncbi:MAG: hypothetical protein ACOY3I_07985 [Verrucomicrobiota bacterium]